MASSIIYSMCFINTDIQCFRVSQLEERTTTVSRYKILYENIFYLLSALNVANTKKEKLSIILLQIRVNVAYVTSLAISQLVNRKISTNSLQ